MDGGLPKRLSREAARSGLSMLVPTSAVASAMELVATERDGPATRPRSPVLRGGVVRVNRPRDLPTFPKGGCCLSARRADLAHAAEPLPIMVRAIRARSAAEIARTRCTMKPDFLPAHFQPLKRCCRCFLLHRQWRRAIIT